MLQQKQTTNVKGGQNKETFLLNVETFKKFCLKAGTKKADEIHDCIKHLKISDKTLNKALDKNIMYNNYYFKYLESKVKIVN